MTPHHPPRACFTALSFNFGSDQVFATFTDQSAQYRFDFTDHAAFLNFYNSQTGVFFNSDIRNAGVMNYERL